MRLHNSPQAFALETEICQMKNLITITDKIVWRNHV